MDGSLKCQAQASSDQVALSVTLARSLCVVKFTTQFLRNSINSTTHIPSYFTNSTTHICCTIHHFGQVRYLINLRFFTVLKCCLCIDMILSCWVPFILGLYPSFCFSSQTFLVWEKLMKCLASIFIEFSGWGARLSWGNVIDPQNCFFFFLQHLQAWLLRTKWLLSCQESYWGPDVCTLVQYSRTDIWYHSPLLGNGSWLGVPLQRLTTVDPDVRIGRSLPSGKLLVTCETDAGETAGTFWCRCSLQHTIWGGFWRRVVYNQMYIPRALWHLGRQF
jgi:hypothetical protein